MAYDTRIAAVSYLTQFLNSSSEEEPHNAGWNVA